MLTYFSHLNNTFDIALLLVQSWTPLKLSFSLNHIYMNLHYIMWNGYSNKTHYLHSTPMFNIIMFEIFKVISVAFSRRIFSAWICASLLRAFQASHATSNWCWSPKITFLIVYSWDRKVLMKTVLRDFWGHFGGCYWGKSPRGWTAVRRTSTKDIWNPSNPIFNESLCYDISGVWYEKGFVRLKANALTSATTWSSFNGSLAVRVWSFFASLSEFMVRILSSCDEYR